MSQPDDERLSGTLFGSLQNVASALGALSTTFALGGIACLLLGAILLIFISDLKIYGFIILGAGGVFVLASVIISFQAVSTWVTGRKGRYSTNTAIMLIAFIGLAAVLNFIAFENPKRMDVTAAKVFSLAPRTTQLLKELDQKIEAKLFFVPSNEPDEEAILEVLRNQVQDFLDEFEARNSKFSYEFVDPVVDPLIAREYGITQYPTFVFEGMESEKRHKISPSRTLESDFVTALLIVTGQEQKRVYFLTGHGEGSIGNNEADSKGFGFAHGGILAENYAVSSINLNLPEDREILQTDREENKVNMLVVAAPDSDLLPDEVDVLDDYLKGGGNALFLLEPDTPQTFRDFLARWGVAVEQGHIVDTERSLGDNNEITFMRRGQYLDTIPDEFLNSVLQVFKLTNGLDTVYYPGVTSLMPSDERVIFFPTQAPDASDGEDREVPKVFGTALAFTSAESFLIDDPARNDPGDDDVQGIFFPAVAIRAIVPLDEELPESPDDVSPASIIVFGDSDFASNAWYHTPDNSDFFLNSVNWLVGDIALADIRPKAITFRELVLTRNEFNFMRISGWLLLPLLMALAGGVAWWRRR